MTIRYYTCELTPAGCDSVRYATANGLVAQLACKTKAGSNIIFSVRMSLTKFSIPPRICGRPYP